MNYKISIPTIFLLLTTFFAATAQIKVGDNPKTVDAAALIEMESTTKGFLISRLTQTQINALTSPPTGLMLFNTTTGCLQIRNGANWESLCSSTLKDEFWSVNGNDGTDPTKNFIGTLDDQALMFRVNDEHAGMIETKSGRRNVTLGHDAGKNLSKNGNTNILLGTEAGLDFKDETGNIIVGDLAAVNATELNSSIVIGDRATRDAHKSTQDIVIGFKAGNNMLKTSYNILMGADCGANLTEASENIIIGNGAGTQLGTVNASDNNIILGEQAAINLTRGNRNVIIGEETGRALIEGDDQIIIGHRSLVRMETEGNFAIGNGILANLNDKYSIGNTLVGNAALTKAKSASNNTTLGEGNMPNASEVIENTAAGHFALNKLETGKGNTVFGSQALRNLIEGDLNIAIGYEAMVYSNTTSQSGNVAVGAYSSNSQTGNDNTSVGTGSLSKSTGNENTSIGSYAGVESKGDYNTFLGAKAGASSEGNNHIFIGYKAGESYVNNSNPLFIVGEDNTKGDPYISGIMDEDVTKFRGSVGAGNTWPSSTLQTAGSFSANITKVDQSLTLDETHYTLILDNFKNSITLPNSSGCPGRIYVIVNIDSSDGTVSSYSSFNGGSASTDIPSKASITLQSFGSNGWHRIH